MRVLGPHKDTIEKIYNLKVVDCKNGKKMTKFGVMLPFRDNNNQNKFVNCSYFGDKTIDPTKPLTIYWKLNYNDFNGKRYWELKVFDISQETKETITNEDIGIDLDKAFDFDWDKPEEGK